MRATLQEIRRYPVKAMGGESLPWAVVEARGLVGDRAYAVVDADGKLATGKHSRRFRRRDEVFEFASRTTPEGVRVSGRGGECSLARRSSRNRPQVQSQPALPSHRGLRLRSRARVARAHARRLESSV